MRWLPQSLKLNGCSCWSPSTVSLMFCIFPYIWQFINRFLMLFPQESYALSFKVMKLHKCIYEKFLAYEWSSFDGYIKTFLHLQSSVHQNFLYHIYSYHSGEHFLHDTVLYFKLNRIQIQEVVTNILFSTNWTTPKHSKLLSNQNFS